MLQKTWRHRTEFNGFAAYLVFTLISTRLTALHNLSKEQREIVYCHIANLRCCLFHKMLPPWFS
jgi:hypothetical protein